MNEYLYPNFLHDAEEYHLAEIFWENLWNELIVPLNEAPLWEIQYLGTTFADGTPCRDGNPIFTAASHARGLAIRIIQVEPGDNSREFSFWTDQVEQEYDTLNELVIACVLTRETEISVKDLLYQWVTSKQIELKHARESSP